MCFASSTLRPRCWAARLESRICNKPKESVKPHFINASYCCRSTYDKGIFHNRILRVFRVALFLDTEWNSGVRRICRQIVSTTLKVFDMLLFMLVYVLMGSVLCYELLYHTSNRMFFTSLRVSFFSMFELMTTSNYPDVMMPVNMTVSFMCLSNSIGCNKLNRPPTPRCSQQG